MKPQATTVLIDRQHPDRAQVEAMIRGVYAHEYDAQVPAFADLLIALRGEDGAYQAAAGLRIGGNFFSEIYLDRPVEDVLSDHWHPPAQRGEVAEVSTLAATHPRTSTALISAIVDHLRGAGVRFAFFTVTERLHMMLKRIGVPAHELARATLDKVDDPSQWGRYYDTNPRVVAIHDAFVTIPTERPAAVVHFTEEDAARA